MTNRLPNSERTADSQMCRVLGKEGKEFRRVVTGVTTDRVAEVLSGLQEGDRVILDPLSLAERLAPLLDQQVK